MIDYYAEGQKAFCDNKSIEENPYGDVLSYCNEWEYGWYDAQDEYRNIDEGE